MVSLIF